MRIKIGNKIIFCECVSGYIPCYIRGNAFIAWSSGERYVIHVDSHDEVQRALNELLKKGYYDASGKNIEK